MMEVGTILIVDDSKVYRTLLSTLLRPYASSVIVATTLGEAFAILDSDPTIDVVVCDVVLGSEDGFGVLEHVAASGSPRPRVIMVSGYRNDSGPERAAGLGAVAYLRKPTRLRELLEALQASPRSAVEMNKRFRCSGVAYVIDTSSHDGEHLVWDLYNLGPRGAFLESKGPLPVGEELALLLDVGGHQARVRARVVRVQEPSWLNVGGIGIDFIEVGDEARVALDAAIAEALARDEAAAAAAPLRPAAVDGSSDELARATLDPEALAKLRALDPSGGDGLLGRVVDAYGSAAPNLVKDLQRAHRKGDADAMAVAAHSLRSSCCSLGALELEELCLEVEAVGWAGSIDAAGPLVEALCVESARVERAVAALTSD
jgi:CheY-like chemotaxis protein/HPt (histidine-containing phosphotransfer) domain-containing protein